MAYIVGRCLLREKLKERGMTQVDLALAMNVTVQQVNKYILNKRKMSLQTIFNISAILNCDPRDLYELIEVGNNE